MTYPNGREVFYNYGTAAAADDVLSRVNNIASAASSGTVFSSYKYIGTGTLVKASRPEVTGGLNLTYGTSSDGYAGLDRYLRVGTNKWQSDAATVLDGQVYTYDGNSNRLTRDLLVSGNNFSGGDPYTKIGNPTDQDEEYT